MALSHDSIEQIHELFWSGARQGECVAALHAVLGPPQPSINAIDPHIAGMTERTVPEVWYLERVTMPSVTSTG
jgi:hypothetical protein